VESVKAASDIYAPVSGVIESINETLAESPSLLNKKPQSDGMSFHLLIFEQILIDRMVMQDQIIWTSGIRVFIE
jgi:glycine cleavage system H protein